MKMDSTKVLNNLKALIERLPIASEEALLVTANVGATIAKTKTFYKVHSPDGLWGKTFAQSLGDNKAQIIANTMYASWVNFGNGPGRGGRIYPVSAKALHFFLPSGQEIFAKSVKVSEPKPFMSNAYEELQQQGAAAMKASLMSIMRF